MNPASPDRSGGRDSKRESDTKGKQTPNTDMQADDAGTASSGNAGDTEGKPELKQAPAEPARPDKSGGRD